LDAYGNKRLDNDNSRAARTVGCFAGSKANRSMEGKKAAKALGLSDANDNKACAIIA
jgi:hypothetical protein